MLLFTDARQQIEPAALRLLVENFGDPDVGAASGELMLGDPATGETGKGMGLYWRIEKKIRDLESASGSVAGATGAIYCARRSLLEPLPEGTLLDDVLLPMQIVRKGARVIFDSRARAWDSPDLVGAASSSAKSARLAATTGFCSSRPGCSARRIRSALNSSATSFRAWQPRSRSALLLASLFLPQPLYRAALIAQLTFYALSLVAIAGVKIGPLSRIADPARTFVVLNCAALVAFLNFVTGRKAVWVR